MKILTTLATAVLSTGCIHAQQVFNNIQMKKPNASATVGRIDFFDNTNVFSVKVRANGAALAANRTFTLPYNADSSGDCLVSGGGGQWNPGGCFGTPPVTVSASTGTYILSLTQTGAGNGLTVASTGQGIAVSTSGAGNNAVSASSTTGAAITASNNASSQPTISAANSFAGGVAANFNGLVTINGSTLVDASRNGSFVNMAISGSFTGTHAQNIGTGDTITVAGCTGCAVPAGSNTQVQFNNSGAFGASASLTWNGSILTSTFMQTGAMTITSGGLAVTGGVTVSTGSLIVSAGTLSASGNLQLGGSTRLDNAGGATLTSMTMNSHAGFTGTLAAAIAAGKNVDNGIIY